MKKGVRYHLYTAAGAAAIILALVPVIVALGGVAPMSVLSPIGCVGWLAVASLIAARRKVVSSLEETMSALNLPPIPGSFEDALSQVLRETRRFHRASSAFSAEQRNIPGKLGSNLQRIVELTYRELPARSVELSLYDEVSGLWSQALMMGTPSSLNSQSMLVAAAHSDRRSLIFTAEDEQVMALPVSFAGTVFGAIRVELDAGRAVTEADREVLRRLTVQGALMLIDARFTEELLRLRRVSEETVRAKTGFLANLSHEIRGPLGTILNGAELTLEGLCGELNDDQRETIEMIKTSGDHLLDLVNDVLDYAKVEAGKVKAKPVELSVADLVDDMSSIVRSQAMAKEHKMVVKEVGRGVGILCDKRHIRQMLINLLTNAIKYTPPGGEITVDARRISGNRVMISVTDTGIGIPQAQQSKVFGAFERIEDKYAEQQQGTGLGMPLTRRLAEVNGGTVGFESAEGKGSTFWIIMPGVQIEHDSPKGADEDGAAAAAQGNGECILLIEDEAETRQVLERYLQSQGFALAVAHKGPAVMQSIRERKPELAIVDNDMLELSGEEMVSAIRSNPAAVQIPIVLLSSNAFVFDIERFLKLGVDRCLSKPVALAELASTLRRLIDEKRNLDSQEGAS